MLHDVTRSYRRLQEVTKVWMAMLLK